MSKRIVGEKHEIGLENTKKFFRGRAARKSSESPYTSILYQDQNPEIANDRDVYEKSLVLPLIKARGPGRVLDIGCGIGRWADAMADASMIYIGLDFSEDLVEIANKRHAG